MSWREVNRKFCIYMLSVLLYLAMVKIAVQNFPEAMLFQKTFEHSLQAFYRPWGSPVACVFARKPQSSYLDELAVNPHIPSTGPVINGSPTVMGYPTRHPQN